MEIIRLSFFILCVCAGQTLPTIPNNVFRFSTEMESVNYYRVFDDVQFSLHGIGRHYFDHRTHNDSFRFSSNFDLYHTGSLALDTSTTVEAWLNNFNAIYNFSLPVFGPQVIDTTGGMSPKGVFSKEWDQSIKQKSIKIEYGMSDEITLSVKIPMIDSYVMNQSFFDYSVKPIAGAQILVDYHQNVKNEFNSFFSSNEYSNLRRGLRDTLQIIYDVYYNEGDTLFDGAHSVNWIFQSQIDPINNGLVDEMFIPNELTKNRVSLNDLVEYYYPQKKTGSGLNDIIVGTTILLKGNPAWSSEKPVDALYARVNVSLPFGKTIKSFLDFVYDNNDETKGSDQFKEASIGLGTNRFEIGLYGNKELIGKYNSRLFAQSMVHFSTMTTLNTPVQLFSGGHTKPDSILSLVGNTYKFDMGTGLLLKIGGELELVKNRLRFLSELSPTYKGSDNYSSKNPDWDSWMEKQNSASNYMDVKCELWFINSHSKNRLGPFSFDLFAGYITRLFANNASLGWNAYAGISTFYQGW